MTEEKITSATQESQPRQKTSDVGEMSQWQLIWLRFKKNKLAMGGLILLVILYFLVAFAGFLAPNEFTSQNLDYIHGPPNPITFIGPGGKLGLRPYTYAVTTELDQENFKWVFVADKETRLPIRFFCER